MNIYTVTETSVSPHGSFIDVVVKHAGSNRKGALKVFDAIIDKELPFHTSATDQQHRTIFNNKSGAKLIVTFHCNKKA